MTTAISEVLASTPQLSHDSDLPAGIRLDYSRMSVLRHGHEIQLTATEFKLLAYLLQNPARVITRKELLETVWSNPHQPKTRTVDIHISKLRQKIEADPARPVHLRTIHWSGYKFLP